MQFTASTITGSGRGKDLGFPTINLNMEDIPHGIQHGIYAGFVEYDNTKHMAAIHYGERPVFDDSPSFEVHIIDKDIAAPPPHMAVELVQHLRDVQSFSGKAELIAQLHVDIHQARDILLVYDKKA